MREKPLPADMGANPQPTSQSVRAAPIPRVANARPSLRGIPSQQEAGRSGAYVLVHQTDATVRAGASGKSL
jgi:hypothetical protein